MPRSCPSQAHDHGIHAVRPGAGGAPGAGSAPPDGSRVVVAAHGEVLLERWLPPGTAGSVRVGPLPHLREVAAAAARRPGYVVVLADRDGACRHRAHHGDLHPARHYETGTVQACNPIRTRAGRPHSTTGSEHLTGREPLGGGEQNAAFTAGRVAEAAAAVSAHVILGAGDQHILDAVSKQLPGSTEFGAGDPGTGPVTRVRGSRCRWRTGWSGPRCTRTRSSCSWRSARARWPDSRRRHCCAAERLPETGVLGAVNLRQCTSWPLLALRREVADSGSMPKHHAAHL